MHLSTSPLVLTALITLSFALVDAAPANNNGLALGQVMQKYGLSPSTDAHRHGPKWSLDFSKAKGNNGNGNGHGNNGNGNGNGKGNNGKENNGKGNNGNNGNNGQGAAHRNAHAIKWDKFQGWNTYKANGVNLGGWMEVESGNDPNIYNELGCPGAPDEWTCCEMIGKDKCGAALEKRYASFITKSDIDFMKSYGINTLRIPTTYAAWYEVPGSQLYHGNQQRYLRDITNYAVQQGMHVIMGLHSFPGGSNSLDIGEALGHAGWWYNATHFQETINVVDSMITFILGSANPRAFTLGAGNEAGDTGLAHFGTPDTISYPDGVNYYNSFMKTVYALLQTRAPFVPLMIQDSFMGASYWAPFWNKGDNIVFDSHFYFFAAAGVYGNIIPEITCGQASSAQTDFPVFVGEWSLEAIYNNTLDGRAALYQSQQYAYSQYLSGGAFWGYKSVVDTTTKIDGEGTKVDYWNWRKLAEAGGIVLPGGAIEQSFC